MFGFGKQKLAPAEVAAGLLGVVVPVPESNDKELETLNPTGPEEIVRFRDELIILRCQAALHAVRHAEASEAIQDAFWVLTAENAQTPLGRTILDAIKAGVDEYEEAAFLGIGSQQRFVQDMANVFARRCRREDQAWAIAVGALHFSAALRTLQDFVASVRVVETEQAQRMVADLKQKQRERWGS